MRIVIEELLIRCSGEVRELFRVLERHILILDFIVFNPLLIINIVKESSIFFSTSKFNNIIFGINNLAVIELNEWLLKLFQLI